jgi:hypothetical protein
MADKARGANPEKPAVEKTEAAKNDWLGKAVVIAGVLISASGLVVSGANFLSTRETNAAKLKADQFAAFRSARDAEDLFWKNAFSDFLGLFDPSARSDDTLRDARLLALVDLVQGHAIPDFEEFEGDVPKKTRCAVIIRAEDNRVKLINGLDEQTRGDPDLIGKFVARTAGGRTAFSPDCADERKEMAARTAPEPAKAASEIAERDQEASVVESGPAPPPVPTASVSTSVPLGTETAPRESQVRALSQASSDGWDVDVFWCRGPQQDLNYRRAVMLSSNFAELSRSGRAIAAGVKLGRIRIRPAELDFQQREGSPARWASVIADSRAGEQEAAAAVRDSANILLGQPLLRLGRSVGAPTPWYLSLFLCGEAQPAAGAGRSSAEASAPATVMKR